jgi:hypothetical protein
MTHFSVGEQDKVPAHPRKRNSCEAGMVTAELAIGFLAVVTLIATMVGIAVVLIAQFKSVDAAYTAARSAARGDSTEVAIQAGSDAAPKDATVTLTGDEHQVRTTVVATIRPVGILPSLTVRASATADRERDIA